MKNRIIKDIIDNGGLDLFHLLKSAKQDGVSAIQYIRDWVKSNYGCHGNTARAVARYFY